MQADTHTATLDAETPTADVREAGEPGGATSRNVLVHPFMVRLTHWLNAVAILIMIGSGWRIWNSDPIFNLRFPVAFTLGGAEATSQDVHNETGLAGALQWHFAGMWLLVINGLIYAIYGIVSGHFRHAMFPVGPRAFFRDAVAALRFRLPHELGVYNAVQKTLYLGVLAAGVVMVLTGLAIWKPGQFQEIAFLFGGFDTARLVHFLGMSAIALFVVVHLALVVIVPKTLGAMITGRATAHGTHHV
jgi:thiosulfate reductase cytochrome b subunit